jgi:hypothetical protein
LGLLTGGPVRAAGYDFIDETMVARPPGGRELGIELGSDSRIDRDYRLQGWFTPEVEVGLTRSLLIEGSGSWVNRGRGLEFGAWRAESRYCLLEQGRWPASFAAVTEYEEETRVAKHPGLERLLSWRAVVTRTFAGSLLTTVNAGLDRRIWPINGTGRMVAVGVRYPEGGTISYGFEYRERRVEHEIRLGPEIRIVLPHRMTLRLGGSFGHVPNPYRFIGRAILESDL